MLEKENNVIDGWEKSIKVKILSFCKFGTQYETNVFKDIFVFKSVQQFLDEDEYI